MKEDISEKDLEKHGELGYDENNLIGFDRYRLFTDNDIAAAILVLAERISDLEDSLDVVASNIS